MSKTLMGLTMAAATLAFAALPTASFAKNVKCYGAKDKPAVAKMSAKKCKKLGGTTVKPADDGAMKTETHTTTTTTTEPTPAS